MTDKVPNKHLWDVNALSANRVKRGRFAHAVWFLLVAAAAWIAYSRGGQPAFIAIGCLAALLPGVIGVLMISVRQSETGSYGLLVIAWTLLSALGLVATGGAASPLTVLFALGPMTALVLGRRTIVIEAAVFGVMAYMAAVLIEAAGMLPPAMAGLLPLASALALAALIMLALLLWAALGSPKAEMASQNAKTETDTPPLVSEPVIVGLPAGSGHLLVDITREGRLRAFSGDTFGWAGLKVGQPLRALLPGAEDNIEALIKRVGVIQVTLQDGSTMRLTSEPHDTGARILVSDISAEKQAEATAISALETLREEMKGQTAFFAGLGHDLKTPLNAILGYADMMRAGIRGPMPEAYQDYPEIIHESGQDLLLLVDDILDLSKAEVGKHRLELEPVDLAASGQSVMRQLENQAERRGIKLILKTKAEVWAEADARAVRQIWQNLLSNAIKYSEKGQRITLDAYEDKGVAALSVIDKGAGMDATDLARIAEPFAQGTNARGRAGTGLGLAVVQRFAELHGGQVRIDTAPGKGTRVEVTLPLANAEDFTPFEDAAE